MEVTTGPERDPGPDPEPDDDPDNAPHNGTPADESMVKVPLLERMR
jgi:hypothetical protein